MKCAIFYSGRREKHFDSFFFFEIDNVHLRSQHTRFFLKSQR
jgi:hypothetical protein